MNRSFKSIFNRQTGVWQVASELASSTGKTGSTMRQPPLALTLSLAAVLAAPTYAAAQSYYQPFPEFNGTGGAAQVGGNAGGSGGLGGGGGAGSMDGNGGAGGGAWSGVGGQGNAAGVDAVQSNATESVASVIVAGFSGGGGGAATSAQAGLNGAAGAVQLNYVFNLPEVRDAVVIGGGGGGAGAGAAGHVGGNGGAGGSAFLIFQNGVNRLSVSSLAIGGDGGSAASYLSGQAGAGGAGTLSLERGVLEATNIMVGGAAGSGDSSKAGAGGAGVLVISGAATIVSTGGMLVRANGSIQTRHNTGTVLLDTDISGAGDFTQTGAGTTVLAGSDTRTGNTTVAAGRLQIGNGGNTGSLAGNVALSSSASLDFNRSDALTYAGVISGSGQMQKLGSGTTTLTGANTYTGTTTVGAGTLQAGAANAYSSGSAFSVAAGATLNLGGYDQTIGSLAGTGNVTLGSAFLTSGGDNSSTTFAGMMSGTGGLIKVGTGTLTLTGANTYSGGTTIKDGTLKLAGNYTQQAGQILGIGARSSSDYGKLLVTGNAYFNPDARIDVDVAAVNTLSVGGTLSGVITASNLTASTFNVTDNSALFNFNAVLNGNNAVDLIVSSNSSTGIRDAVAGQGTSSAAGAAQVLDGLLNSGATGDMGNVINALGQLSNNRDVSRAVTQTLPLVSGNQAIQGTLGSFQRLIQNRTGGGSGLSSGDALLNKEAWSRAFGSRATQDDRNGASGFSADSWGMAFGADAQVTPDARFGVAYGYAKTSVNGNTDLSGTGQRANIDSHMVSAYGSKDIGNDRSVAFQADIGMNDNKSARQLDFGGLKRTATADYRTYSAHVGAAITQQIALSQKTTLTPGLRADYTWLKSQGYSETGANALNMQVASNTADAFVLGADAHLQHRFSPSSRMDANLGVGYDAINNSGNIVAAYAGAPGQSFVTTGIDHSPWLVRGGVGYVHTTVNGTEIALRYDAEGRSDYLNQTASVRAKWMF